MNTHTSPSVQAPPAARRGQPLFLLIPLTIGATLTGLMTWLNVGFAPDFLWRWATSLMSALPVMAMAFVLMTVYGKWLGRLWPAAHAVAHKLALALCMAFTLESLLSAVVTLRNVGLQEGWGDLWLTTFLHSLPIGLCIGLLMGFIVRPWMQRLSAPVGRVA